MRETLDRSCARRARAPATAVNLERACALGRPARRAHRAGPRRRHRRRSLERTPSEHWELVRVIAARRARPLRRAEGLDRRRRRLAHRRRRWTTTSFTVSLIPTTLALTTLGRKQVGDPVNLEVDVIAKYVERLLATRCPPSPHPEDPA